MNDIEKRIIHNITTSNLIEKNDKVIVGLSGGADSLCLLNILNTIKSEIGFSLYAAHLDHKIRGIDAHKDALFCYDFCKENNIPFFLKIIDIPQISEIEKMGIEETARKYRYSFFEDLKKSLNANKIAVAHNLDDQVETFFINMFRGSGLDGLKSMELDNNDIIRPLLSTKKSEILDYCKEMNLNPVYDKTNSQTNYLRNKIRLELIPYIEKEFEPNIKNIVFKNTKYLAQDNKYIKDIANVECESLIKKVSAKITTISVQALEKHKEAIKNRIIRKAIELVKGDLKEISSIHVEDVLSLCKNNINYKMINLPNSINVYRKNEEIIFSKGSIEFQNIDYDYELDIDTNNYIKELGLTISFNIFTKEECIKLPTGRDVKAFDFDKIQFPLKIRSKKDGDKIKPIGFKGTKKISDIFTDNKIDRFSRDKYPVICDNRGILWLWNYRISEDYKIDDLTKKVLRIILKFDKED